MKRVPAWSYGLTTVPARRGDLLPRTLASLAAAGFDRPRLFVDGANHEMAGGYAAEFRLPVTAREPALRTAGNWWLALAELYVREPAADRYAVFQDDLVTVRNLRAYLDRLPYPEGGYLNCLSFLNNEQIVHGKPPGWYEASLLSRGGGPEYHGKRAQTGRGAVALVFSREAVQALLSSPDFVQRPVDVHMGWRRVDGGIVTAMNKQGWREMVHSPSLVQHTGDVSSMGNRRHPQAMTFPGEQHDALTWLDGGQHE